MVSNLLNCLFIPEISYFKNFESKTIQIGVTQKNISTESIIAITGLMTLESNCLQLTTCSIRVVDTAVKNGFHQATFNILNPTLTLY